MQFDTDLVTLRQQSAPFYLRWQFWWTTVPILLTLMLAATAIMLRVTSPNAVGLQPAVLKAANFPQAVGSCLLQQIHLARSWRLACSSSVLSPTNTVQIDNAFW